MRFSPGERALTWLAAATLAMLGVYLRVSLSTQLPQFDPDDDTGYYHVESAFQYRYAKRLAFGPAVPSVDAAAQYPEGVRVGRDVSLVMERATAASYKALGSQPPSGFHRFTILWIAVFCALPVLALFAACERLSRAPPLALLCAGTYASCWAAASVAAGRYGFLAFSAPLLLCAAALLVPALDPAERRPDVWAGAAASAVAVSLASWHSASFMLSMLWLALLCAALRARESSDDRRLIARASAWLCGATLVAGALSPLLRESRFLASPAFWLGPAVWSLCALRGRRRWAALALATAAVVALPRLFGAGPQGYMLRLVFYKLRFALAKPTDAARLPQDMRLLWVGPFDSPSADLLAFELLPLGLLAGCLLWARRRPRSAPAAGARLFEALAALTLAAGALISQLMSVFAFFLCALPAAVRMTPRGRRLWSGLAAAVLALELLKCLFPASPLNPALGAAAALAKPEARPAASQAEERALLDWLARRGSAEPVAAPFGESASILAYTGLPVLMNPKWEARGAAAKAAEFDSALFSDEAALLSFCTRYGARLLVYPADALLDDTPEGLRYAAGRPPLTRATAAFELHFSTRSLSSFSLLYQNEDFRVFSVGRSTQPAPAGETPAVYDLAQFSPTGASDGTVSLDVAGALARRGDAQVKLALARLLTAMGRREEALAAYESSFSAWPPGRALRDEEGRLRAALERPR